MYVHVHGWNPACVFRYLSSEDISYGVLHRLETPKTRKKYTTTNQLTYTRTNEPKEEFNKH